MRAAVTSGVVRSWRQLVGWLLAAPCLGCGRTLPGGPVPLNLCAACRGRLQPVSRDGRCARCARPLAARDLPAGWRCGACRRRPPAFSALHAGFVYRPPLAEVVQALKFSRLEHLAGHLGTTLADRLRGELPACDAVVPVPLHWRRRWMRGYDQAEGIAAAVAARLGLPLAALLKRRRSTPAQTSLPRRQRLANPAGAFGARRRLAGERLLLVDDVATTGATLDAAARCLVSHGAAEVTALVVALTPRPEDPDAAAASHGWQGNGAGSTAG